MLGAGAPFVLLDDARKQGAAAARLYCHPVEIVEVRDACTLNEALAHLRRPGHWAGYVAYEAGLVLEPKLGASGAGEAPLLWFGRYEGFEAIQVDDWLPPASGGWIGAPRPAIDRAVYDKALAKVQAAIVAGDIYQANLTFQNMARFAGHPLALYAGLRKRAAAGYGGVVWTGRDWLLSLSPELFFALKGGRLTTRPMKGTAARTGDDAATVAALRADPKQRAENLMIVDLLRNDISRVAVTGTVETPELFQVETYPTVHQMTSTVTGRLREGRGAVDAIEAMFPCGSITGAPKIRAMEIIGEVEASPRGIYTGSIGRIDPSGDAAFNVAIRTLHIKGGADQATLGLGSGIVADSRTEDEWAECLAKGRFVADPRRFDLFETMRFDPAGGIHLLDRHVARIGESARTFGISFDRHEVRNQLQAATFRIAAPRRVRLMLSMTGRIAIEVGPLHSTPAGPVEVAVAPRPVAASDFRLAHKTSDRAFYKEARSKAGTFEVALVDAEGFVTEGSFTNIFVKGAGALLTPPAERGLLPGILRAELLANGSAREADLRPDDLAGGFFIGNASRGMLPAKLQTL